jgi:glyoxylase-like metal-dependent hydrolase (beta-lactamase superfamily II)/8-oxo-dGTP pyrophosphatase MutT (NUDIX family)
VTGQPVQPKLAATVVLVRPGAHGLEVLLTKRPSSMAFAPDVYVFPGGRVDATDADPSLQARSVIDAVAAAKAMGGDLDPVLALAAHVAAVRELFEEAGVLLADVAGQAEDADGRAAVATPSLSLARSALVGGETTFGAIAAELDLRLRTDLLVPLSRWVTPPVLPRRFDARFFAAQLPARARVSFEGGEVEEHAWLTPAAALQAMGEGAISMWLPTSATLQHLQHAGSIAEIRDRLGPWALGEIEVEHVAAGITRIVMPAGGGVAGQPVCSYLVGDRRSVLIDPGDPTGPGLVQAVNLATAGGGTIEAIALTHADPDHAGGVEALAEVLGIPVLGGPGAGRAVPYTIIELRDLERIAQSDVVVTALLTPGPRPEHVAYLIGDPNGAPVVVSGDLGGVRGARSIVGPIDEQATNASRDRLRALAPEDRWLAGHPAPAGDR